jgi:hypothetical protein
VIVSEEDYIKHYGTPRHSGRYKWGSGGPENKKHRTFLDEIAMLKKQGMTDAQIAKGFNLTRNELTAKRSIANSELKQSKILQAQRLKDKGWGSSAIGRRMGVPESTVRLYLTEGQLEKARITQSVADMLKRQVDEKEFIDVGKGVEHHIGNIGITDNKLKVAVAMLKEQGYRVHSIHIEQANLPGQFTKMQVLAKPGVTLAEVNHRRGEIKQITDYSEDHGRTFINSLGIQTPVSVNSKRIGVNYAEDGGAKADGVIYVRPGVRDIRIGDKRYAQVRIAVDGTHYMKGMAIYKDDLPPGVDLVFNTNKSKDTPLKSKDPKGNSILKPMSEDKDNPFGSIVRQVKNEKGKVDSAMNLVNEEGNWDTWAPTLSSQMLSKQRPELATKQLDLTYSRLTRELDEINSLTNPVVRKELLFKFGDTADSAAVHLKAAAMPKQATKVILPVNSVKPGEIYNPDLRDGTMVALVRHPHGGTFEIPQLKVNNKNLEARRLIGQAKDAIGIHHSVAQRLSGADFDGDTVLVIPNNFRSVKSTAALEGLKDFDPMKYKIPDDSPIPRIKPGTKQNQMGVVSNLITDMTLRGAETRELAQAIRHSMVVIDSEKHNLDYKQSERDNGILGLKQKYQSNPGQKGLGASTLISRAKAKHRIPQRRPRAETDGGPIDKVTGKKMFVQTGKQITDVKTRINPSTGKREYVETGTTRPKLITVPRLSVVDDAHTLKSVPGTTMESIYANHSNRLKALGNTARLEALKIKPPPAVIPAKKIYAVEVKSLNAKLRLAERNAPLERQAQLLTSVYVSQAKRSHPDMDRDEIKKVKRQYLNEARIRTHPPGQASKQKIDITTKEWQAIQAGAIAPSKLKDIITNSDLDRVRELALPKRVTMMSPSKIRRAQTMLKNGHTQADVADALGVGVTTLKVALSG